MSNKPNPYFYPSNKQTKAKKQKANGFFNLIWVLTKIAFFIVLFFIWVICMAAAGPGVGTLVFFAYVIAPIIGVFLIRWGVKSGFKSLSRVVPAPILAGLGLFLMLGGLDGVENVELTDEMGDISPSDTYADDLEILQDSATEPTTPDTNGLVEVSGYTKEDGTVVGPHHRTPPDSYTWNNLSSRR